MKLFPPRKITLRHLCQATNVENSVVGRDFPGESALDAMSIEEQRRQMSELIKKRGMLENGSLLSNFLEALVRRMTKEEIKDFKTLLENTKDAWDVYYWATGVKKIPDGADNKVMAMIKDHCDKINQEVRLKFYRP